MAETTYSIDGSIRFVHDCGVFFFIRESDAAVFGPYEDWKSVVLAANVRWDEARALAAADWSMIAPPGAGIDN